MSKSLRHLLALAALAGTAACADQAAVTAPAPVAMAAPQPAPGGMMRMPVMALESRRVVGVMPNGDGSIDVVYAMGSGSAVQSARVVRLENVNGMLEVIYDPTRTMPVTSGRVTRVRGGDGGMLAIDYAR